MSPSYAFVRTQFVMNKWKDVIKPPNEGKATDLSYQCSAGSKYNHETSQKRMDFQINSLHQQTKSDNCNGLPPSSTCFYCGMGSRFSNNLSTELQVNVKEIDHVEKIFRKFDSIKDVPISAESLQQLTCLSFNSWDYDDADMLFFLQSMFVELSLLHDFQIEVTTFQKWLMKIYLCYNDVPFHNFKHCFCVTQMTYSLIHAMKLQTKISQLDVFILLFSALCHDLDHPGFSNAFQVNSVSNLSIVYNDSSPLENHHCSTAFKILMEDHVNILKNWDSKDFLAFRKGVIRCILATDMAKHDSIMSEFTKILDEFDYKNLHHKHMLMMVIIKLADISNEMRSTECSTLWMDCLFEEYFNQSDVEREMGLPVTPFMDRSRVNKLESQVNFIKTFLLPSLKSLAQLEDKLQDAIGVVEKNLIYYQTRANQTTK